VIVVPKWTEYLSRHYKEVVPLEFYRDIFQEGELDVSRGFTKGKYVGVAVEFTQDKKVIKRGKNKGKEKQVCLRHIITDDLNGINELLKSDNFVIISPISYYGWSRSTDNAVKMYAFAIEIDELRTDDKGTAIGLDSLMFQMENKVLPMANYIVCSGSGIHLYYVFEQPLILYDDVKKSLMRFKSAITPHFWNKYVTSAKEVQQESAFQGFRLVGGVTKKGDRTRVFKIHDHPITPNELNEYVSEENQIITTSLNHLTREDAKDLYPEWYEKRIVKKQPKGVWAVNRAVYDNWIKRISSEAKVGARYHCMLMASYYAIKCGNYDEKKNPNPVTYEELEEDLLNLLKPFDSLSRYEGEEFTEEDVVAALQAYDDKGYINYPIDKISQKSGISIQKNKRNGRKQEQHLQFARGIKNLKKQMGESVNEGRPKGSGTAEDKIKQWKVDNPAGTKKQCKDETGLSYPTIRKWW
jgi:hypothetical protein